MGMANEESLQVKALQEARILRPPEELSIHGLALRQHLTGWSQAPRIALLMGIYFLCMPGFLTFYFVARFIQVLGTHDSVSSAVLTGGLALLYLLLLTVPAVLLIARGLRDLRARPQLVGGRVVAVRHLRRYASQAHYVEVELPSGKRERFRVDPMMHNLVCQPGRQIALSVSPSLRYVSKVWSDAEEPPVLV